MDIFADLFWLSFFGVVVLPFAWPGSVWAIVHGTRWLAKPDQRTRLATSYRLRAVTWLIAFVPLVASALSVLMLVSRSVGSVSTGPEPSAGSLVSPLSLVALMALVAVLICARAVAARASRAAAWVMVALAGVAGLAIAVAAGVTVMWGALGFSAGGARMFALVAVVLVLGAIANALLAVAKVRAVSARPAPGVAASSPLASPSAFAPE